MDPLKSALNLLRRLPPEDIEKNFQFIATLREDIADDLRQQIELPLKVGYDSKEKKGFILSDFNTNGTSYRSPWSNEYFPPTEDTFYPSPELRKMEETANFLFDKYREFYYGAGVSSVYLWENDDSICGCFMILNEVGGAKDITGSWHAFHLVEVIPDEKTNTADYRLTSTIQLFLTVANEGIGKATQNGTLTRQSSSKLQYKSDNDHIANIGQMIEQMENYIRSNLDSLYMSRNQDTVDSIRILNPMDIPKRSLLAELSGQLRQRME